jgi:SAM-dependent methyltransferase
MPHWMLKAAVQGSLSLLPQPQRWNRLLQRHVTRSLELDDAGFLAKWSQGERHVEHIQSHVPERASNFTALELGTGWFPVIPVGLALAGASAVYTVDMYDLTDRERTIQTLERFEAMLASGRLELANAHAGSRARELLVKARDMSGHELLAALGIRAIIGDARALELPSASLDLICSNNTLEHIPAAVIASMFTEFRRLLRPPGVMSHFIDMADHYALFDRKITRYNFLRYPEPAWRLFNNELHYQNRLRLPDFRALHEQRGFEVLEEENRREPLEVLRSVPLAERFAGYDEDDLAVYDSWMVSRPRDASQRKP